jgi:hypothetical protein
LAVILALGASMALAQTGAGSSGSESKHKAVTKTTKTNPAAKVALNPQPLPPGAKVQSAKPAGSTNVKPQPLPPSGKPTKRTVKSASDSTPK